MLKFFILCSLLLGALALECDFAALPKGKFDTVSCAGGLSCNTTSGVCGELEFEPLCDEQLKKNSEGMIKCGSNQLSFIVPLYDGKARSTTSSLTWEVDGVSEDRFFYIDDAGRLRQAVLIGQETVMPTLRALLNVQEPDPQAPFVSVQISPPTKERIEVCLTHVRGTLPFMVTVHDDLTNYPGHTYTMDSPKYCFAMNTINGKSAALILDICNLSGCDQVRTSVFVPSTCNPVDCTVCWSWAEYHQCESPRTAIALSILVLIAALLVIIFFGPRFLRLLFRLLKFLKYMLFGSDMSKSWLSRWCFKARAGYREANAPRRPSVTLAFVFILFALPGLSQASAVFSLSQRVSDGYFPTFHDCSPEEETLLHEDSYWNNMVVNQGLFTSDNVTECSSATGVEVCSVRLLLGGTLPLAPRRGYAVNVLSRRLGENEVSTTPVSIVVSTMESLRPVNLNYQYSTPTESTVWTNCERKCDGTPDCLDNRPHDYGYFEHTYSSCGCAGCGCFTCDSANNCCGVGYASASKHVYGVWTPTVGHRRSRMVVRSDIGSHSSSVTKRISLTCLTYDGVEEQILPVGRCPTTHPSCNAGTTGGGLPPCDPLNDPECVIVPPGPVEELIGSIRIGGQFADDDWMPTERLISRLRSARTTGVYTAISPDEIYHGRMPALNGQTRLGAGAVQMQVVDRGIHSDGEPCGGEGLVACPVDDGCPTPSSYQVLDFESCGGGGCTIKLWGEYDFVKDSSFPKMSEILAPDATLVFRQAETSTSDPEGCTMRSARIPRASADIIYNTGPSIFFQVDITPGTIARHLNFPCIEEVKDFTVSACSNCDLTSSFCVDIVNEESTACFAGYVKATIVSDFARILGSPLCAVTTGTTHCCFELSVDMVNNDFDIVFEAGVTSKTISVDFRAEPELGDTDVDREVKPGSSSDSNVGGLSDVWDALTDGLGGFARAFLNLGSVPGFILIVLFFIVAFGLFIGTVYCVFKKKSSGKWPVPTRKMKSS